MAILTDPLARTGAYIVSEGDNYFSRDNATAALGAGVVLPGTVMGKLTASGNFVPHVIAGALGSEIVSGILYEGGTGTVKRTVHTRHCQVNGKDLIYPVGATAPQIVTINAALKALGIVVR
jgi:hypothetical protein